MNITVKDLTMGISTLATVLGAAGRFSLWKDGWGVLLVLGLVALGLLIVDRMRSANKFITDLKAQQEEFRLACLENDKLLRQDLQKSMDALTEHLSGLRGAYLKLAETKK